MDYNELGLDAKQLILNNPFTKNTQNFVQGIDYNLLYDTQAKFIRSSKTGFGTLVFLSNTATALGTFNNSTAGNVSFTLTPNPPYTQQLNFAIPFVSIYAATSAVGSLQIFPKYGSGIANSKYVISAGFDYNTYTGTNSVYLINIENNSGTNSPIFAIGQWKVLVYNVGTSS